MKTIWKVLAWIFLLCGVGSYLLAWGEIFTGSLVLNMTGAEMFYDAIAAGIFGMFFLVWGYLSTKK